ncbi:MAG: hypothetical protein AB8C02_03770 [Halioglobus sp.]
MTAETQFDLFDECRELNNAIKALMALADITPDDTHAENAHTNVTLLKMVAQRIETASMAYMVSAESALDAYQSPLNSLAGPLQPSTYQYL